MPHRDWRTKAELEATLLQKIRAVPGCETASAVVVEAVHDPRLTATWTIGSVAGPEGRQAYADALADMLPLWQGQYGLTLPPG